MKAIEWWRGLQWRKASRKGPAGVAMVVFADPVYEFGRAAAEQLAWPGDYLAAVLQPSDEVPR